MFDSYNFGQTVSPEVGQTATTPGESPRAEEAFATFGDQSPFGGPASPQPKVKLCCVLVHIYLLKNLHFHSKQYCYGLLFNRIQSFEYIFLKIEFSKKEVEKRFFDSIFLLFSA